MILANAEKRKNQILQYVKEDQSDNLQVALQVSECYADIEKRKG